MILLCSVAFVVLAVWVVLLGLAAIRANTQEKQQWVQKAFAGRESLTHEEFYECYFLGLGIDPSVVFGVREILAEQLGADMSRLSAEDDFSRNLSFFWDFDSMVNVELVVAIEKHFQIVISDSELEKTCTVFDLIQLVAKKSRALKNIPVLS